MKRHWKKPLNHFLRKTKAQGKGLYVVGLDCHVGYLVYQGKDIEFCHSAWLPPHEAVVCEKAKESWPIVNSKYRVTGKILDDNMMKKWLNKTYIKNLER